MISRCVDILRQAKSIQISIACALVAAIVSYASSTFHGSQANNSMLAATHWLMVVLLTVTYMAPKVLQRTDVEVVWMTYGFLFGEMGMDSVASYVLVLISAVFFHLHRRTVLLESSETIASSSCSEEHNVAMEM